MRSVNGYDETIDVACQRVLVLQEQITLALLQTGEMLRESEDYQTYVSAAKQNFTSEDGPAPRKRIQLK